MVFKQKNLKNHNGTQDPPPAPSWKIPLETSILFFGILPFAILTSTHTKVLVQLAMAFGRCKQRSDELAKQERCAHCFISNHFLSLKNCIVSFIFLNPLLDRCQWTCKRKKSSSKSSSFLSIEIENFSVCLHGGLCSSQQI